MPIFTRYVLGELIKVFSVTLTAMTLLLMIVGVIAEAVKQSLGLPQVILLLPYALPDALRFAVPATILFASSSVYGRLAASNEIVALKSMGISPMVAIWPAFILAFLLSLAAVWLNDVAVSWGREGARRVVIESVEEIAYGTLRTKLAYSTKQMSINVRRVEGRRLINPILTFQATGNTPTATITAEEAELRADPAANTLTITCRNGTIEMGGLYAAYQDTIERVVPLDDASKKRQNPGPSDLAMSAIPKEKTRNAELIEKLHQELAARTAMDLVTGDFAGLFGKETDDVQSDLKGAQDRYNRLNMEPHRRWANGFSCLCFVMVGAPFAILWRRADFLSSFGAVFMPVILVYYPLLLGGVDQAKSGSLPPYSVWLGNLMMGLWGVWLLRRVIRY